MRTSVSVTWTSGPDEYRVEADVYFYEDDSYSVLDGRRFWLVNEDGSERAVTWGDVDLSADDEDRVTELLTYEVLRTQW